MYDDDETDVTDTVTFCELQRAYRVDDDSTSTDRARAMAFYDTDAP